MNLLVHQKLVPKNWFAVNTTWDIIIFFPLYIGWLSSFRLHGLQGVTWLELLSRILGAFPVSGISFWWCIHIRIFFIVIIIPIFWINWIPTSIISFNFLVLFNKILCLFLSLLLLNQNFRVDWGFLCDNIVWSCIWSLVISRSRSCWVFSYQCCLWPCFFDIWFLCGIILTIRPRAPLCLALIHIRLFIGYNIKLFRLNILEIGSALPAINIIILFLLVIIIIVKLIDFCFH